MTVSPAITISEDAEPVHPVPSAARQDARRFMLICIAPVCVFLAIVSLIPVVIALIDSVREMSLTAINEPGSFLGCVDKGWQPQFHGCQCDEGCEG